MIDADKLLSQLTVDNVKEIVASLGGIIFKETDEKIIYNTICHNITGGKPKLEYYKNDKFFFCYTECSCGFNIFKLIEKRKKLLGEKYSFPMALEYCCKTCNIPYEQTQRITQKTNVYNWQKDIEKYIRNRSLYNELEVYDKTILNFFPKIYHKDWLDFGISEEVLELYGIRWYRFKNQIVIPVYDENGNLVGIRGRCCDPKDVEDGRKYIPLCLLNGTIYKFSTNLVLYGLNFNEYAIRRAKTIILCEAEKSVMKLHTWYGFNNIGVATLGSALGKYRRNKIIELGVETVIILADKDYKDYGDEDFIKWRKKIIKLANEFKGFCKVEVIYDSLELVRYKENACDGTKEVFEKLYENREVIEL